MCVCVCVNVPVRIDTSPAVERVFVDVVSPPLINTEPPVEYPSPALMSSAPPTEFNAVTSPA